MKKFLFLITITVVLLFTAYQEISINEDKSIKGVISEKNKLNLVDITKTGITYDIAVGDEGIYFANANNIVYMDIKSGETTMLCNRVECLHKDETCTGYMEYAPQELFMNPQKDKLFFTYCKNPETFAKTIGVMDINGENERIFVESNE